MSASQQLKVRIIICLYYCWTFFDILFEIFFQPVEKKKRSSDDEPPRKVAAKAPACLAPILEHPSGESKPRKRKLPQPPAAPVPPVEPEEEEEIVEDQQDDDSGGEDPFFKYPKWRKLGEDYRYLKWNDPMFYADEYSYTAGELKIRRSKLVDEHMVHLMRVFNKQDGTPVTTRFSFKASDIQRIVRALVCIDNEVKAYDHWNMK